jgi:threonine/homoserine/homoserine lactone efflux protein
VHATAAAVGLSALLVASLVTFTVVKVVGAGFLVYLGVRTLIDASQRRSTSTLAQLMPSTRIASSPFWQGFWSNVLNPKVALLFLSLLPQLDRDDPIFAKTLFLSSLFLAMGIAWLLAYAALVSRLAGSFRSDRVRRRMEAISGGVLIGLGLRIAVQDA